MTDPPAVWFQRDIGHVDGWFRKKEARDRRERYFIYYHYPRECKLKGICCRKNKNIQ
jgi:hypothetical protein